MPRFRERQQRVGGATFKRDVWLKLSDTACGIKGCANGKAAIKQQERV